MTRSKIRRRAFFHTSAVLNEAEAAEAAPAVEGSVSGPQKEDILPQSEPTDIVWTTNRLNDEQIAKVDKIFHKILWLDTIELALLTASINHKLGLQLTPSQQAALQRQVEAFESGVAIGGVGTDPAAKPEEDAGPQLFDLKLVGFDDKAKIKVIKEVRAIAGLGLKESKELVEGAPSIVQKEIKQEQAEELKAQLEAVGAQVELV